MNDRKDYNSKDMVADVTVYRDLTRMTHHCGGNDVVDGPAYACDDCAIYTYLFPRLAIDGELTMDEPLLVHRGYDRRFYDVFFYTDGQQYFKRICVMD